MAAASAGDRMSAPYMATGPELEDDATRIGSSFWSELERIYRCLARNASERQPESLRPTRTALERAPEEWNPVPKLREIFGLTDFETDILLLCAGLALDRRFSAAISILQPESPS